MTTSIYFRCGFTAIVLSFSATSILYCWCSLISFQGLEVKCRKSPNIGR